MKTASFLEPSNRIPCALCGKLFQDERARKNHILSVHDTSKSTTNSNSLFICPLCPNGRSFPNEKALADHRIAKHEGSYTDIKPDWASCIKQGDSLHSSVGVQVNEDGDKHVIQKCKVCSHPLENEATKQKHILELLPIQETMLNGNLITSAPSIYPCSKCSKPFRDQRSQFQHENFCQRTKEDTTTTASTMQPYTRSSTV
jgi:hypothetical protein